MGLLNIRIFVRQMVNFYIFVWIIRYYANGANNFPYFEGTPQFLSPSYREITKKKNKYVLFSFQAINFNLVMNCEKLNIGYRQLIFLCVVDRVFY